VIPCTTNLLGEGLFRVALSPRQKLEKPCEAMIEQIRGIPKKRILAPLGHTDQEEMRKIETGVKALLEI
jgi:mRNA-degrading endonuclease toxin of MazEF toxin-antitoxin module